MKLKEPLSGALHFLGLMLAVIASVFLILSGLDSAWKIVSFSIYGATLILLYNFSTIYHWIPKELGGETQLFRKLDHLAIYLLIAGTYTPFCLVTMRGPWGWSLFGIVWGLALAGILIQSVYINVDRRFTTLIYVGMGWMVLIAIKPLLETLNPNGIWLLVFGGVAYSVGGIVYALKKPNFSKYFGFHELWHLFVLLGSFFHFLAVYYYVARI
ncbi:MAG: hemolysin III family protein [Candidatus Margulisbacteria bacterium]|nr:hemolysin III family protein [Candidatus Margulisiibacteriota bacterium]